MRHPVIKVAGYILVALVVGGLVATVVVAAMHGQPFYGRNYMGLALGTYSTLAMFGLAAIIGFIWAGQRAYSAIKRFRAGSPFR
jgi:hypothetical protein